MLTFISHAQSVKYNYACSVSKEFDADLESTTVILFVIHLFGDRYNTNASLQLCSTESGTSMLNGLDCGSAYNFIIHFAHPNGSISDCPVQNSNFEIRTLNSPLDFSCPSKFIMHVQHELMTYENLYSNYYRTSSDTDNRYGTTCINNFYCNNTICNIRVLLLQEKEMVKLIILTTIYNIANIIFVYYISPNFSCCRPKKIESYTQVSGL